ncbi:MAG: SIS domain-containing protein [Candidatus Omnitrophica bacterium]|nr:SIS domain-containing protein [Candidatus Omnitrophota bacterium]
MGQLEEARKKQNTIFIIGNGGSAVTASHMANDFALGSRAGGHKSQYRALSLADNTAVITAISNDCGYDKLFVEQLKVHYRAGDKLVAISASGNSQNVISAAKWVKEQGGTIIGLLGFDGGKLKGICDIAVHIETPKGEYGPVEDIHMIIDHLIYTWLHYKAKKAGPR